MTPAEHVERLEEALTKDGPGGRIWINTQAYDSLIALASRVEELEQALREIVQAYPNPSAVAYIIASGALGEENT